MNGKIAKSIAKFRLRFNRGKSLLGFLIDIIQFTAYFTIIQIGLERYLAISLNYELFLLLIPVLIVILYLLGHVDERVGFWKFENRYKTEFLNPHLQRLKIIEKKIDNLYNPNKK